MTASIYTPTFLTCASTPANAVGSLCVGSFNVLAQCLLRRELFPYASKNALKGASRKKLLTAQISELANSVDVLCLQEVDQFSDFFEPLFQKLGFSSMYTIKDGGYHGLLIAYKNSSLERVDSQVLNFNDLAPSDDCVEREELLRGNVGQLLRLRLTASPPVEVVITNVHLFWNWKYRYVRLCQAKHLQEQALAFARKSPTIYCGDFNFCPDTIHYRLITAPRPFPFHVPFQLFMTPPDHYDPEIGHVQASGNKQHDWAFKQNAPSSELVVPHTEETLEQRARRAADRASLRAHDEHSSIASAVEANGKEESVQGEEREGGKEGGSGGSGDGEERVEGEGEGDLEAVPTISSLLDSEEVAARASGLIEESETRSEARGSQEQNDSGSTATPKKKHRGITVVLPNGTIQEVEIPKTPEGLDVTPESVAFVVNGTSSPRMNPSPRRSIPEAELKAREQKVPHIVDEYENLPALASVYSVYENLVDPTKYISEGERICWKGEPQYTNLNSTWHGTLDYIFLHAEQPADSFTLVPTALARIMEKDEVRKQTGLPSDIYPSDHVPIACRLVVVPPSVPV